MIEPRKIPSEGEKSELQVEVSYHDRVCVTTSMLLEIFNVRFDFFQILAGRHGEMYFVPRHFLDKPHVHAIRSNLGF